jgi:hypothetical protein
VSNFSENLTHWKLDVVFVAFCRTQYQVHLALDMSDEKGSEIPKHLGMLTDVPNGGR